MRFSPDRIIKILVRNHTHHYHMKVCYHHRRITYHDSTKLKTWRNGLLRAARGGPSICLEKTLTWTLRIMYLALGTTRVIKTVKEHASRLIFLR